VFADAAMQSTSSVRCTSTKLSPLVPYEAKFAPGPHAGTTSGVYDDYGHQLYDQLYAAGMNGHCGAMYKVEQPSPSTTPNSEPRATDAAETWNSSAYHNSRPNVSRAQTGERKGDAETPDRDKDLAPLDVCQSTTSDDDSDDLEAGSASTKTSPTMTTASDQHQQQQHVSTNSSCDVRETHQRGVVLPIYPWMTRVHSTHGKLRCCTNI